MKNSFLASSLLAAGFVAMSSSSAFGVVIISNTAAADNGNNALAKVNQVQSVAAGFSLPGGTDYTIDTLTLGFNVAGTTTFNYAVELWSNSGGQPSASLGSFNLPTLSLGTADYSFTPTTTLTLNGGNSYWIVAYGTQAAQTGETLNWRKINNPSYSGAGSSIGQRIDTTGALPPVNSSSFGPIYQVNGTVVVPEVSQMSLIAGLGCAGFGIWRFRNRAAKA